ncbi:MarR family transcriptional regulator [Brevundimonas sp. AAP58]|uniref:MarR family winged helix-turn-helix transcriptional regulator n=1 Tax=Brevundimonas sp. AAP58 TaxID=1523422 RepID=UPI0006B8BC2E|nr:MarR family transcriptional regulator [Brevundimonas sp. AAP58]KPF75589.1 MarR family transcriptional regulator [Brevundimonas sp. AAP58]
MGFQKDQSAGYLTNHLARLFAHRLHDAIAPIGLAPAQFMTLIELWNDDGLTQAQLVERLDVEQATLANTLKRMERDGLIERSPHPSDGRSQIICLTEKARFLEVPATSAAREISEDALMRLRPADRQSLIRLMQQLLDTMREEKKPARDA